MPHNGDMTTTRNFAAVRKSNDFTASEMLRNLREAGKLPRSVRRDEKPEFLLSERPFVKAWREWCAENGVPTGGGGADRRAEFGEAWGV